MLQRLLCLLVGYLCGGFLTAELVARARTGKSAAALGTGNPGMANLAHELGKGWGAVVLAGHRQDRPGLRAVPGALPRPGRPVRPVGRAGGGAGPQFPPLAGLPWRKGGGRHLRRPHPLLPPVGDGRLSGRTGRHPALRLGAVVIPALFVPPAFLCCGREAGLLALILALVMLSRHIRGLGRILRGEEERKFRGR